MQTNSTAERTPGSRHPAGSDTSERYKQELGNMARRRLLTYPDQQAEAIAKHYIAHSTIALQILKMVECRRHAGGYPELDRSIQMLVAEIKNNHWHDFGIELEWPNDQAHLPGPL